MKTFSRVNVADRRAGQDGQVYRKSESVECQEDGQGLNRQCLFVVERGRFVFFFVEPGSLLCLIGSPCNGQEKNETM